MQKLSGQLNEIEGLIKKCDARNERISAVSVGWQLTHALKTIIKITQALESSTPSNYKKQFSVWRLMFMTLGWFPRGKARAPKVVRPTDDEITVESLHQTLEKTRAMVSQLSSLAEDAYFPHPYFKDMRKNAAIRFLEIHTNHHLKIARDICKG